MTKFSNELLDLDNVISWAQVILKKIENIDKSTKHKLSLKVFKER